MKFPWRGSVVSVPQEAPLPMRRSALGIRTGDALELGVLGDCPLDEPLSLLSLRKSFAAIDLIMSPLIITIGHNADGCRGLQMGD
mmetsp:Transcript_74035/g.191009  ORF Transcript_74035/g.191009 Transcript_74035/m.191009 type:complete len:85 (+) Transcript_74035:1799-2053(+)